MKIYTKTGDSGTTSLFGGMRVPKSHFRIEAYGTVDELNAHIGLLRDQTVNQSNQEVLIDIQNKVIEARLAEIRDVLNHKLIPLIFQWNGWDTEV